MYPWSEVETVLPRYAAFAPTMPDELGLPVATASGPDGQPAITLLPLWNGDKLQGERAMDHLQALGKPQFAQFGPMTYTDMLAPYDARVAEAEIQTRSLPALTPGAVDAIITAVAAGHRSTRWSTGTTSTRGHAYSCRENRVRLAPGPFHGGDHRRLGA